MPARSEPSPWLLRWAHLIAAKASVLDLAAGSGRHTRWLAARGHAVTAVDIDAGAMQALRDVAEVIVADLERDRWPLGTRRFDAVLVTNYLWRPLLPPIVTALAPGGVLVYETFGSANATIGRPANPGFLLAPGELLVATAGLRTVAYEDGFLDDPDRFVQRIVAVREATTAAPARHRLAAPSPEPGRREAGTL